MIANGLAYATHMQVILMYCDLKVHPMAGVMTSTCGHHKRDDGAVKPPLEHFNCTSARGTRTAPAGYSPGNSAG